MPKRRGFTVKQFVDLASAGSKSARARVDELSLAVFVGEGASPAVVQIVKDALMPVGAYGRVSVRTLDAASLTPGSALAVHDAFVVIPGEDPALLRRALAVLEAAEPPLCVAVESAVEGDLGGGAECVVVSEGVGARNLAKWLVESCEAKRVALGANFAFCRPAVSSALTLDCAKANAAVGAIDLISGADMPVMLMSQAALAFDIAAAHGRGMEPARAAELAAVAAGAVAYRALARRLVHALPQAGWLLRGAIGFAGSYATGELLARYHEFGPVLADGAKASVSQLALLAQREAAPDKKEVYEA